MRFSTFLLLTFILLCPTFLAAQNRKEEDFSKLFVSGYYSSCFNQTTFNDYYKKPGFVGVQIGTTYLHGMIKGDLSYSSIHSKTTIPSYTFMGGLVGYDYAANLVKNLKWMNGFAVGISYMNFDDPSISSNLQQETEMMLKLNSTLQYQLGKHIAIGAGCEWSRIYTQKRIDFLSAKIQLSYYFTTAQSLRRWME